MRTEKVLEKVFKHASIVFFYNLCTICKVPGYQRNRRMATVLEFSSASMDVNVVVQRKLFVTRQKYFGPGPILF